MKIFKLSFIADGKEEYSLLVEAGNEYLARKKIIRRGNLFCLEQVWDKNISCDID